jgi:hypothetical protein
MCSVGQSRVHILADKWISLSRLQHHFRVMQRASMLWDDTSYCFKTIGEQELKAYAVGMVDFRVPKV